MYSEFSSTAATKSTHLHTSNRNKNTTFAPTRITPDQKTTDITSIHEFKEDTRFKVKNQTSNHEDKGNKEDDNPSSKL